MKKKILSLILIATMAVGMLTACGSDKSSEESIAEEVATKEEAEEKEESSYESDLDYEQLANDAIYELTNQLEIFAEAGLGARYNHYNVDFYKGVASREKLSTPSGIYNTFQEFKALYEEHKDDYINNYRYWRGYVDFMDFDGGMNNPSQDYRYESGLEALYSGIIVKIGEQKPHLNAGRNFTAGNIEKLNVNVNIVEQNYDINKPYEIEENQEYACIIEMSCSAHYKMVLVDRNENVEEHTYDGETYSDRFLVTMKFGDDKWYLTGFESTKEAARYGLNTVEEFDYVGMVSQIKDIDYQKNQRYAFVKISDNSHPLLLVKWDLEDYQDVVPVYGTRISMYTFENRADNPLEMQAETNYGYFFENSDDERFLLTAYSESTGLLYSFSMVKSVPKLLSGELAQEGYFTLDPYGYVICVTAGLEEFNESTTPSIENAKNTLPDDLVIMPENLFFGSVEEAYNNMWDIKKFDKIGGIEKIEAVGDWKQAYQSKLESEQISGCALIDLNNSEIPYLIDVNGIFHYENGVVVPVVETYTSYCYMGNNQDTFLVTGEGSDWSAYAIVDVNTLQVKDTFHYEKLLDADGYDIGVSIFWESNPRQEYTVDEMRSITDGFYSTYTEKIYDVYECAWTVEEAYQQYLQR